MHAQENNAHLPRSVQAQAARSVLQANLAYGESNTNGLSYTQRLKARKVRRFSESAKRFSTWRING